MRIIFHTKDVKMAEKYIDESTWKELKENKIKVLDAVKKGLVRITDPLMHGSAKISTGDEWYNIYPDSGEKEFSDYVYGYLLNKNKELTN